MKKSLFLSNIYCLFICGFSIFFSISCSNEKEENPDSKPSNEITLDPQVLLNFENNESSLRLIDTLSFNSSKLPDTRTASRYRVSTSILNQKNLNQFISLGLSDQEIFAITVISNPQKNSQEGIFIHSGDGEGKMNLRAYKKTNNRINEYELIDFPVSRVNGYTLDNILFLAQNLFPNHDLNTVSTSNIDQFSDSGYDDLALLAFAIKHKLKSTEKYNLISFTDGPISSELSKNYPVDGKPCSMAAHQCRNGNEYATVCHPTGGGCRAGVCPRQAVVDGYGYYGKTTELSQFNSNLPETDMYTFRDQVFATATGQFWTDAFYATSKHFAATLNLTLLSKITVQTPKISQGMYAYINNQNSYLLNAADYDGAVEIMEYSANRSESDLYKDVVNDIKQESISFRNQTIGNIKVDLNNPKT